MPDSIRRPPSEPAAPSGQGGSDGRQEWPGQRLGLPREGPRSIARLGHRVGGLVIDWALASVVAYAFFDGEGLAITAVFVVVQVLFLVTLGGTPGHLALGMRLVPMRGGAVGLWRPLVRSLLVALVVRVVVLFIVLICIH